MEGLSGADAIKESQILNTRDKGRAVSQTQSPYIIRILFYFLLLLI